MVVENKLIDEVKEYVRVLLGLGIQLWGDGVPVKFTEAEDNWDSSDSDISDQGSDINPFVEKYEGPVPAHLNKLYIDSARELEEDEIES